MGSRLLGGGERHVKPVGPFRALEYRFTVQSSDVELAEILSGIFEHCRTDVDTSQGETLRIDVGPVESRFTTDTSAASFRNDRIVPALVSHVNLAAAQRGRADRAVLHAGSAVRDAAAVVFPGRSGSGKSTLAATLMKRGWGYVADELVGVDSAGTISGYPKSLTLKEGSWSVLGIDATSATESNRFESPIMYVPPEVFGSTHVEIEVVPRSVVFPQFSADRGLESARLSPGETLVRLIECAYLPLTSAGFASLAALAGYLGGFAIRFSDVGQIIAAVDEALADPSPAVPTTIDRAGAAGDLAPDIIWADLQRELVAYDPGSNAVVHLDADGRRQWHAVAVGSRIDPTLRADLQRMGFVRT